tara:strand:+ start:897 stop:1244 length:348 start_codon:yes stop_codon:yes gene_type:complete
MGQKKHYIDNSRFEELIKKYCSNEGDHEEELIQMFDLLISNILSGFKFAVDPDDARQECFLLVLKTLKNFTPKKGSAFNYFTTVIMNNLRLLYTKDKKYDEKIEGYIQTRIPRDL